MKGFEAAAVGGIGNNRGALMAGWLLGLAEAFGGSMLSPGYQAASTFALLLIVLCIQPRGLFGQPDAQCLMSGRNRPHAARTPWSAPLLLAAAVILVAVLPMVLHSDYRLYLATQVGIYLLVAMGLNLLSGYAGQPSLCHGALLAVGAYVTALATTDHGWSFWPAALVGMVTTAAAGALIALPAFRVSAWYFALITLAFADVVGGMLVEWAD